MPVEYEKKEIRINKHIYNQLSNLLQDKHIGSRFKSVEEIIEHLAQKFIEDYYNNEDILTEDERRAVEERLRKLGYF